MLAGLKKIVVCIVGLPSICIGLWSIASAWKKFFPETCDPSNNRSCLEKLDEVVVGSDGSLEYIVQGPGWPAILVGLLVLGIFVGGAVHCFRCEYAPKEFYVIGWIMAMIVFVAIAT